MEQSPRLSATETINRARSAPSCLCATIDSTPQDREMFSERDGQREERTTPKKRRKNRERSPTSTPPPTTKAFERERGED